MYLYASTRKSICLPLLFSCTMPFCETLIPQSPEIPVQGLKLSHEANYMAVSRTNHTLEVRKFHIEISYTI